jgi:hypothetical protein
VNGINSETCSGQPEPTFASPMAGWSAITEWNAQPRPVSTERTTDPTYLRAAEQALVELGAPDLRAEFGAAVDLDGDGTMEVVIRRYSWEASDVSIWRIVAGKSPVRVGQAA